jgi:hypothetical protein
LTFEISTNDMVGEPVRAQAAYLLPTNETVVPEPQVIVSIVGIDQWPPGALRVQLADRGTGETEGRVVCVYVWPSQLRDFDKFVDAIEIADAEAVSGGGIDRVALRESWQSHRVEIDQVIERAKQPRQAD